MKLFIRVCRIISISSLSFALLGVATTQSSVGEKSPPPRVKFQVVSVNVLGDKEAIQRAGDFVGANIAIRLRLSCTEQSLYFYSLKDTALPVGYPVRLTDAGVIWLAGESGTEKSSPGLKLLTLGLPGSWNFLPSGARPSIEWEELDSTSFVGEKHARTAFIKFRESDNPVEVFSDSYTVPGSPQPSK